MSGARTRPMCTGCSKRPDELPEYVRAVRELNDEMSPDEYVICEEGTFNPVNGHFLCTACYIVAGMPAAPGGWRAP